MGRSLPGLKSSSAKEKYNISSLRLDDGANAVYALLGCGIQKVDLLDGKGAL